MAKRKVKTDSEIKISIVIPTFNSWQTLIPCIKSVYNQTLKPYEIIVVDNASSDQTVQKVKKGTPYVKLIPLEKNTGVTGGRNSGIKAADKSSGYLFFFDHDMVADKNMLQELVEVAKRASNIGIVTPKIYFWTSKRRIWSAGTSINLLTGQIFFRGGMDVGQYEKIEEVQVAPAAMLVKRKVVQKLKKFDERYFATYEDTDFCFRAKRAGFKTYYAPRAIAFHKISEDPRLEAKRLMDRGFWVGRNRVLFMRDFGVNFLAFTLFVPIYFLYYLRLAIKFKRLDGIASFIKGTFYGYLGK